MVLKPYTFFNDNYIGLSICARILDGTYYPNEEFLTIMCEDFNQSTFYTYFQKTATSKNQDSFHQMIFHDDQDTVRHLSSPPSALLSENAAPIFSQEMSLFPFAIAVTQHRCLRLHSLSLSLSRRASKITLQFFFYHVSCCSTAKPNSSRMILRSMIRCSQTLQKRLT